MTVISALARSARHRFPNAYWRVRNTIALGEWGWHRVRARAGGHDAYDDQFWNFHTDEADWDGFARVLCERLRPRSLVDVGCGQGRLLAGLRHYDASLHLHGFDDSAAALSRAAASGLPVARLDLGSLSAADAEHAARQISSFDVACCLEVAEHLPPWRAGTLLRIITAAPRVVFSAAHPNQGGVLHVNEQPASYWIARFARLGFALWPGDDELRQAVAALRLPHWYGDNIHVFERGEVRGSRNGGAGW
jgi:SAM-dependent methyltransferase